MNFTNTSYWTLIIVQTINAEIKFINFYCILIVKNQRIKIEKKKGKATNKNIECLLA